MSLAHNRLSGLKMNYWLVSDTHFNHARMRESRSRFGDWQGNLWSGLYTIPEANILIHLGDICIGNEDSINRQLTLTPAKKKILVRGNHDEMPDSWYYGLGWDFVCDGLELVFQKHRVWLSHRPQPPMNHFVRNIHGHTHGNEHRLDEYAAFYKRGYHLDISPELVGFDPQRLDTLMEGAT
jgi:calcineurin-like phosphoesterase family protein